MNELKCIIPDNKFEFFTLAHGGGGSISNDLIKQSIIPYLSNNELNKLNDGAVFNIEQTRLAFSTDSFVVDPIFFPGGNIGELAVNGTVNDIACCGAEPLFISLAFIIEEGFSMQDFSKIMESIANAANHANVKIVTGDTKVVPKGKADKIFINTSGIGIIKYSQTITPESIRPGDKIIISGSIGNHGMAIMLRREEIKLESELISDTCALNGITKRILSISDEIKMLRDPTRGGVASSLNEIASSAKLGINIYEAQLPIDADVASACELLGFDPLYVANEGKILVFVSEKDAEKVLAEMRTMPESKNACIIGEVTNEHPNKVVLKTAFGTSRIVDMLSGEQLPRIC